MSTATHMETIDMTRPGIPMSRLIRVELRKLVDTRAGKWLLISIAAICTLVMIVVLWVGTVQGADLTFNEFSAAMGTPMGVLLPVLGILSVTSEWGQRTGLVTFTLEPRRSRTIIAKLVSGLIVAVASIILAFGIGALGNVLFGLFTGAPPVWNVSLTAVLGILLAQTIGLVLGFGFGMLILNSAAAIVLFFVYSFVLPGLFAWGASLMQWFHDLQPWIDFSNAQTPLYDATMTGKDWAQFATAGLIWFVLPMTVGIWRLLRSEVK